MPSSVSVQVPFQYDVLVRPQPRGVLRVDRPPADQLAAGRWANTHDRSPTSAVAASFQFEARSVATTATRRQHRQVPFSVPCDPALAQLQHDVLPQPMPGAPATLWPVAR